MIVFSSIFGVLVFVTTVLSSGQDELVFNNPPYTDCGAVSSCGNFRELMYPFADSSHPSYCRHPGFQVTCQAGTLMLMIDGRKFKVLDINREKELVTLTTEDMLKDICPEKLSNHSFNDAYFSVSENTVAAKLLSSASCHHPHSLDHEDEYICNNNHLDHFGRNSTHTFYLSLMSDKIQKNIYEGCQLISDVLMLKKAVVDFSSNKIIAADALKQGFELSWAAVDMSMCTGCETTGGVCGYNASLAKFSCFCLYGNYLSNCSLPMSDEKFDHPRGKTVDNRYIIAGVTVAMAVVIMAAAVFIVVYRKRNKDDNCNTSCSEITSPTYYGLIRFQYNDLREATNFFDKVVGSGANSNVHHGILKDGREVAVKRMFGRRDQQFMNELDLLARLHHQNLVDLYGYCSNDDINMLVYEYLSNGTLLDHIRGEGERAKEFLAWSDRMNIAIEIASTLVYLHASNVVHCDVKSDNILIDHNLSAKLGDFGISRLLPDNTTHVTSTAQGTDGYLAPECDGRSRYHTTSKRDVYSFGVVLLELVSSKPAMEGFDEYLWYTAIEMIDNDELEELVDQHIWAEADTETRKMIEDVAELGCDCLQHRREDRPDMEYVLKRLKEIRDGATEEHSTDNVDSGTGSSSVSWRSHSFPGASTRFRSSYTTAEPKASI